MFFPYLIPLSCLLQLNLWLLYDLANIFKVFFLKFLYHINLNFPSLISVCDTYRFGQNCSEQCGHCRDNQTCHFINGICKGGCAPGFIDETCNKGTVTHLLMSDMTNVLCQDEMFHYCCCVISYRLFTSLMPRMITERFRMKHRGTHWIGPETSR